MDKYKKEINSFINSLPFKLTKAQDKVISEILKDLSSIHPMNRFLQGDVGSGKTIIAVIASYITSLNKFQSLIMAPTEILAKQHFQTFKNFLTSVLFL